MEYQGLINSINRGLYSPVYIFYGEEKYLQEEIIAMIKQRLVPDSVGDFNLDILDGQETTPETVIGMANTLPFMAEKRLVIVNDARWFENKKKSSKEEKGDTEKGDSPEGPILEYLENPLDSTCLIFTAGNVDKRKKLYKAVGKAGQVVEFAPLKGIELNSWIEKKAHSFSKKISPEAMAKLITAVGSNLNLLENELQKLSFYIETRPAIEADDVEMMVSKTVESSIFELLDAVGERKYNKALLLIKDMLFYGEAPIKILFMIIRQIRLILAAKIMGEQGSGEKQIAATLQIHPFVAQKCLRQGRNFTTKELEKALIKLLEVDEAMKTGKQEPVLALERFIVEIGA